MEQVVIRGVSVDKNEAKLTVTHVPDEPGRAARLFQILADDSVNVDMIVQNVSEAGLTDISCTVPIADLDRIRERLSAKILAEVGAAEVLFDPDIAKVSVVGIGMRSHSGVAAAMFSALADTGVNIEMITTSEIKISCVLRQACAQEAARALHAVFGLGEGAPPADAG